MDKLLPINDWIMVEEYSPDKVTKSGLIIPAEARKKGSIKKCKVIAISDDVHRIVKEEGGKLQYKIGDIVIHHSQTGLKVNINDPKDKKLFLKWDAVMALVQEEEQEEENTVQLFPVEDKE